MLNKALYSTNRDDWCTPQHLVDLVIKFNSGKPIETDPCWNRNAVTNPTMKYGDPYLDGLQCPWNGLTYVNPPYSHVAEWVTKSTYEATRGVEIVLLVPARTDTKWWQNNVRAASAVCFWKGRLKFLGGLHSAPFPSALWYFGRRTTWFYEIFAPYGWTIYEI